MRPQIKGTGNARMGRSTHSTLLEQPSRQADERPPAEISWRCPMTDARSAPALVQAFITQELERPPRQWAIRSKGAIDNDQQPRAHRNIPNERSTDNAGPGIILQTIFFKNLKKRR
jgi:hypothetical protein